MATTTSTASAPRRRWSGRFARSGRTSAGICRAESTDGYGLSLRHRAPPCRSRHRAADHGRLRDHRRRRRSRPARAAGLDVVVCDHHAPRADGRLPDCADRPSRLCAAIRARTCAEPRWPTSSRRRSAPLAVEDDIELVALATVADLMPLLGENRRLVREGLRSAVADVEAGPARADDASRRPIPSALDTGSLGFRLAPRINAAGRLRRADAGLELLLTADEHRAAEIAAELDHGQRRAAGGRTADRVGGRGTGRRAGRRGARAVLVRARGRGLASRGRRDRRLPDRRAPSPPGGRRRPGRGGRARARLGASRASTCSARCTRAPSTSTATAATAPPPACRSARDRLDGFRARDRTPRRGGPAPRDAGSTSSGSTRSHRGASSASSWPRSSSCSSRAGWATRARGCSYPGRGCATCGRWGKGATCASSVGSGGNSARAVAFGCDGRLGVGADEPARRHVPARAQLLERRGRAAPRARATRDHARRHAIEVLGEPEDYLTAALAEPAPVPDALAHRRRAGRARPPRSQPACGACATPLLAGGEVLAVCADAPRRRSGLQR